MCDMCGAYSIVACVRQPGGDSLFLAPRQSDMILQLMQYSAVCVFHPCLA